MINNKKAKLEKEYFDRSNKIVFRIIQYCGLLRYGTRDGRFVKNTKGSFLRSILIILVLTFCCSFITYHTFYSEILTTNEVIMVIILGVYSNSMFLNINFFNRNSLFNFFEICMDIDEFIGIRETKFMRDTTHRIFRLHIMCIVSMAIVTSLVISVTSYYYVELHINLAAFLMVLILHGVHLYIGFFIISYLLLSTRVHFLNKALMKKYNGNKSSIFKNKTLLFDGIIWKEQYDDLVSLNTEQFRHAFSILFRLVRQMERCYRFLVSILIIQLNSSVLGILLL